MKKCMALILTLLLAFGMCGCGISPGNHGGQNNSDSAESGTNKQEEKTKAASAAVKKEKAKTTTAATKSGKDTKKKKKTTTTLAKEEPAAGFVPDTDPAGDAKKQAQWEASPEAHGIVANHKAGGGAAFFAIIGLLFSFVIPPLAVICGLLAIILGSGAIRKYGSQKGRDARTGGVIALILGIIFSLVFFLMSAVIGDALNTLAEKINNGEIKIENTEEGLTSEWTTYTLDDGRVIQIPADADESDYADLGSTAASDYEGGEVETITKDENAESTTTTVDVNAPLSDDEERYHATWTLDHVKVGDAEYTGDDAVAQLDESSDASVEENQVIVHSNRTFEQVLVGESTNGSWTVNDEGKMVLSDADGKIISTARINSKGFLTFEGLGDDGNTAIYYKKA